MTSKLCVALTFDDGLIEHYSVAQLLNRLGIRATFFVVTHIKNHEGRTLLTSRPELMERISKKGHEIGSHTKTHPNLTTIPLYEVEEEARESKQLLENLIGTEIRGFAYPYGAYNANVVKIISKYYKYARGGGVNPLEDPFNVKFENLYTLGAFARQRRYIRKLLKLPVKLIKRDYISCIRIALVLHAESLPEILMLITYLKSLPAHTCFMSMSELLNLSSSDYQALSIE